MGNQKNRLSNIAGCLLVILPTFFVSITVVFTPSHVLALSKTDRKTEADRLLQQGIKQIQTSQFEAALQSWRQALIIYREINDNQGERNALGNISLVYLHTGDYPKSIDYSIKVLEKAKQINDRTTEGKALGNIGIAYLQMGDYPKAINYLNQSLEIALVNKDRQDEGKMLSNIGLAYLYMGDYSKSIEFSTRALIITLETKNRQGEGVTLLNIGLAHLQMGDYLKTIDYLSQSLKIAREILDKQNEGKALGHIGLAYLYIGDYPKSIDYSNQWLKLALEVKDRASVGGALANIGLAHLRMRDYNSSINYLNQSLEIAREILDRRNEGRALGHIGLAYLEMKDYSSSINYLNQSLDIAREIRDVQNEGKVNGNIGIAYSYLEKYSKSIQHLNQWLKISKQVKSRSDEGIALNNLGYIFYKLGKLSDSENYLLSSIKVFESIRNKKLKDANKVSLFETQRNAYSNLQQVYIAQNKVDTALEIAERGRTRAFVDLMSSRLSSKSLNTEIFSQPLQINQIRQIAKTQNSTFVEYSIISDDFKVAGKIQRKVSKLYIWVIKPSGNTIFRQVDLKSVLNQDNINELTTQARNNIGAGDIFDRGLIHIPANTKKTSNDLRRLHDLLIKPIAGLLPKNENEKVVFIPQGSLFLVPFPALQDEAGKYLIEKHTILTAPSIQVLDLIRKLRVAQKTPLKDVLIVGNPTMPVVPPHIGAPPQQLAPLPGAEKEAKAIGNLLNTKPLIGNEATKAAVLEKLPRARFVHLATHGIFDDVQGINSSIALAPSSTNGGDGLLTAGEILDLKLNAELVVLSACDTGRGKITGDGVIGLSRALISAGVPSVLVSLWSVPDAPTSLLMTEFYKNLQKNPDKAQALRQAMLTTMRNSPNPVDWAAFTLIGEAN